MTSVNAQQLAHKTVEAFKAHRRGQADKYEKELTNQYQLQFSLSKDSAEKAAQLYLEATSLANQAIKKENDNELIDAQQGWLRCEEILQEYYDCLQPAQKIGDFIEAKKELVTACHALVERSDGKFLFLKRSKDSTYAPNLWHVPGGVVEWGQTLQQTVSRELLEETSISWNGGMDFAFAGEHRAQSKKMDAWLVDIYGYIKLNGNPDVKLSKEHEAFRWLTLVEATYLEMVPDLKEKIKNWTKNR